MVNETRKAELEILGRLYLAALCEEAGLDASGSKEELIDRLLESEGQATTEPEVEPGEGTGTGEGSEEPGEGSGEPGED